MPLDINRLANEIESSLDDYDNISHYDKQAMRHEFALKLSTAIINEIKQSKVTVPGTGLSAGSNAVTGTSTTGTLS